MVRGDLYGLYTVRYGLIHNEVKKKVQLKSTEENEGDHSPSHYSKCSNKLLSEGHSHCYCFQQQRLQSCKTYAYTRTVHAQQYSSINPLGIIYISRHCQVIWF